MHTRNSLPAQSRRVPPAGAGGGQFWYGETVYKGGTLEHTPLCVFVEEYSSRKLVLRRLDAKGFVSTSGGEPDTFAPGPEDILSELFVAVNSMRAEGYAVGIDIDFWITENQWVCQISEDLPFDVMPTILGTGETLAEACALAWLELKKQ